MEGDDQKNYQLGGSPKDSTGLPQFPHPGNLLHPTLPPQRTPVAGNRTSLRLLWDQQCLTPACSVRVQDGADTADSTMGGGIGSSPRVVEGIVCRPAGRMQGSWVGLCGRGERIHHRLNNPPAERSRASWSQTAESDQGTSGGGGEG